MKSQTLADAGITCDCGGRLNVLFKADKKKWVVKCKKCKERIVITKQYT